MDKEKSRKGSARSNRPSWTNGNYGRNMAEHNFDRINRLEYADSQLEIPPSTQKKLEYMDYH